MSMRWKCKMSLGIGLGLTFLFACVSAIAVPVTAGAWRAESSIGEASVVVGVDGEIDEIRILDVDTGVPHFGRKDLMFGTGPGYHHIEWAGNDFTAGASHGIYSATRAETYAFRVLGTVVTPTNIVASWSAFGSDSYTDAQGVWQYEQYALQGTLIADRVHPDAPGLTLALSPAGPVPAGQKRPVFNWEASARATWYRLVVKRAGRTAFSKWIQAPATTFTPLYDLPGGDYTWQIAGHNLHGLGQASSGVFSIPVQRPGILITIAPTDGSVLSPGTVAYQFLEDPKASWCQIWIGRNGPSWFSQWYNTATPSPGGLVSLDVTGHVWGRYRWCVRGWGTDGMGQWSPVGEFSIGLPTTSPSTSTQVVWTDTPVTGATWYEVYIGRVSGGSQSLERSWWFPAAASTDEGGGNRGVALSPPLTTGDYKWYIRAWNRSNGLGLWSDPGEITVP